MRPRPSFKRGLRSQVGNGKYISFWHDNWVYSVPILNIVFGPFAFDFVKVSDFINVDDNWNNEFLYEFLPVSIMVDILGLFIPTHSKEDKLV